MTALTVLIPAYRKDFLGEAFAGLRSQSFKDFRVIVSDDSPGAEISTLIHGGHFGRLVDKLDLTVVRGPQNTRRNHEQLLALWDGATPLVHFHLDDDVCYPEFYRRHVEAHTTAPFGVTASQRWLSGPDGRPALSLRMPDAVALRPERLVPVARAALLETTIVRCDNWLGELSNMVFSAAGAACYPMPPGRGLSYYALLDIGWVLELSRQGHAVGWLNEHLSVFRQHAGQTTRDVNTHGQRLVSLAWVTYALHAWQQGDLSAQQTVQAIGLATQRALARHADDPVIAEYFELLERESRQLDRLCAGYTRFWEKLLASQPATRPAASATPATSAAPAANAAHAEPAVTARAA